MSSLWPDLTTRVSPEPFPSAADHFDLLPDPILLLILNNIADVKSLGRCSAVSRRFHHLVPQVHRVLVRVDCVISDDSPSPSSSPKPRSSPTPLSLIRLFLTTISKPLQSLLRPRSTAATPSLSDDDAASGVTHHSPTQVLKNFNEIRSLRIELPSGELGIDDGVLLRWRADFGSTLDRCVILGASSVIPPNSNPNPNPINNNPDPVNSNTTPANEDNGSIPESFYTNGGLKLRVVWTISSLIAASARHYLLQPIISEHKTLNSLVLTDGDGQGVLCMNKEQLEELRVKPLSASSASKRTLVPALNMRLWYAPQLELPDGTVLKGATLVAIRPSEAAAGGKKEVGGDGAWVSGAFEEPFGTAARMLVKRRTYCLEMNSF